MKKLVAMMLSLLILVMALPISASAGRDLQFEEQLAGRLKNLGLFQGVSDTDFALNRAPTRVEALVMLIRLLGEGNTAQNSDATHPFTDVPTWADSYVGYAYQQGLTNGVSETAFGTGTANAQMYLTFMLRALGYSDSNSEDFSWNNPYSLAEAVGILPNGVDRVNFWRGDVVLVSYSALEASLKNSSQSLAQKLIDNQVFTYEQYTEYYDPWAFTRQAQGPAELSAEEIYSFCSPAVFYIEMYNRAGEAIATGSGFFIEESGVAVTNYHVIEDGYSAKIILPDTGAEYDVLGVYDCNKDYDWAVIQIDGSGFSTLNIGQENTIVNGATVYAIGSPLGLKNTISQGLISNTARWLDDVCYIQTSAAISHGSSGGALINKYGEVIGITSAGFMEGQNLGLALPMSVIAEHQRGTLVSIADLFGTSAASSANNNLTPREQAFALLLATINIMENERINGDPAYTEVEYTPNGRIEYSISKNEDYSIDVIVWEVYKSDTYYTSMTLELYSDDVFVYHGYNLEEDPYYLTGITEIYAPSYTPASGIHFTEVKGNARRDLQQKFCHENLMKGLDFVQGIFYQLYELGNFTIADLGFTNY